MKYFFIFLIILAFYEFYENKFFKRTRQVIFSEKIGQDIKFILISDFHLNPLINLKKLDKYIKDFDPDFICLTGDIINRASGQKEIARAENFLKIFKKKTFYVSGNHEYENENREFFEDLLEKWGIISLAGESFTYKDIKISGIFYKEKAEYLNFDPEAFNLLLIHDPLSYVYGNFKEFDLVLAGHTHGGQVRIPGLGPVIGPDLKLFPKFSKGFYKISRGSLFITSGLGSKFFLRLFNRTEICLFTIQSQK